MFDFAQKLAYYPQKLSAFRENNFDKTLSTVIFYPSTEMCNHDCIFCDGKFYNLRKAEFSRTQMVEMLDDMVQLGADSLIILGDGSEPILFRDLEWLVEEAVSRDIACGIYTNGSICSQSLIDCLNKMEFVRVSLDAGCRETHSVVHGYPAKREDFSTALTLLEMLDKSTVNTGAAFIILQENVEEIFLAWKLLCAIGVHYMELKLPLQEGYRFLKINEEFVGKIRSEIKKIQMECQRNSSKCTELVLNNHLKTMLLEGRASELLTDKKEKPCYTCCFRTIVSPMGYFLCSPLKNMEKAWFGDPFTVRLKDAWESENHMKIVGMKCSICCTYNDQNEVLLRIREGKKVFGLRGRKSGQKKFL